PENRFASVSSLRSASCRRGVCHVCATKSIYWRGSLPADPTKGASAETVAFLVHSRPAPASARMAPKSTVRRLPTHRVLWPLLRRQDCRPGTPVFSRVCALHLLGRLQRVGLEDDEFGCAVQLHADAGVRHAGVRFCEYRELFRPRQLDGATPVYG